MCYSLSKKQNKINVLHVFNKNLGDLNLYLKLFYFYQKYKREEGFWKSQGPCPPNPHHSAPHSITNVN